jgi:hypothetical protein
MANLREQADSPDRHLCARTRIAGMHGFSPCIATKLHDNFLEVVSQNRGRLNRHALNTALDSDGPPPDRQAWGDTLSGRFAAVTGHRRTAQ